MTTLRNLLSKNQIKKLEGFISMIERYLNHYNEVNATFTPTPEMNFAYLYPINQYNNFIKELFSDRILKGIETITFCRKGSETLEETIFEPEYEDLVDVLPTKKVFPLISRNILDSKNYKRELLNFMEIESDVEIAISKAKFFEEVFNNLPEEFPTPDDSQKYPEVA